MQWAPKLIHSNSETWSDLFTLKELNSVFTPFSLGVVSPFCSCLHSIYILFTSCLHSVYCVYSVYCFSVNELRQSAWFHPVLPPLTTTLQPDGRWGRRPGELSAPLAGLMRMSVTKQREHRWGWVWWSTRSSLHNNERRPFIIRDEGEMSRDKRSAAAGVQAEDTAAASSPFHVDQQKKSVCHTNDDIKHLNGRRGNRTTTDDLLWASVFWTKTHIFFSWWWKKVDFCFWLSCTEWPCF